MSLNKKMRYYAFISYKREDEKWAKWLQDKLEHYRFPTNLNGRTDLPKNIRPTFRDVTDLTPGLLAEEIDKALRSSEWLIVICSHRSAKSPWVCKEAQTFIDTGRADHIIPFVIEGVPFSKDASIECYPEALLNLTDWQELLAANINEMGRDAAAIKVVARMFGLRFDTLWQRHEKEKHRRRNLIVASVVAFGFVVLGIAGHILFLNRQLEKEKTEAIAARKIAEKERNRAENERNIARKERTRAELAEDSIRHQFNVITQINKEIVEKHNKLLITQSRYLASEAQKEYKKGNITKALRMALYALPKDVENQDRPCVLEAEQVLRRCEAYASQIEGLVRCKSIFTHQAHINSTVFSQDGKYLVTASDDRRVQVWDTRTGKSMTTLYHKGCVISANISPNSKYIITATNDNKVRIYDIITGKMVIKPLTHKGSVKSAIFSPDGKYIITKFQRGTLISDSDTTCIWDAITGEPIQCDICDIAFSPDGRFVATSYSNYVSVWNISTGTQIIDKIQHRRGVKSIEFTPNGECLLVKSIKNKITRFHKPMYEFINDTIYIWEVKTGNSIVCPSIIDNHLESTIFSRDGKYVVISKLGNSTEVIDFQTGEAITKPLQQEGVSKYRGILF